MVRDSTSDAAEQGTPIQSGFGPPAPLTPTGSGNRSRFRRRMPMAMIPTGENSPAADTTAAIRSTRSPFAGSDTGSFQLRNPRIGSSYEGRPRLFRSQSDKLASSPGSTDHGTLRRPATQSTASPSRLLSKSLTLPALREDGKDDLEESSPTAQSTVTPRDRPQTTNYSLTSPDGPSSSGRSHLNGLGFRDLRRSVPLGVLERSPTTTSRQSWASGDEAKEPLSSSKQPRCRATKAGASSVGSSSTRSSESPPEDEVDKLELPSWLQDNISSDALKPKDFDRQETKGSSDCVLKFGAVSKGGRSKGTWKKENQDQFLAQGGPQDKWAIGGVFDGHGLNGLWVSTAVRNLMSRYFSNLDMQKTIRQDCRGILIEAFQEVCMAGLICTAFHTGDAHPRSPT